MGHHLGIDFGTSNSTMSVFDAALGAARVLYDAEGQDKTPSVVYYGCDSVLVGAMALNHLREGHDDASMRTVMSVKRNLITPPWIALPEHDPVRPVHVAAEILAKLERDAEQALGGEAARTAVITCPAVFDGAQRSAIVEAGNLAGFAEIELVEEPVAAALAFENAGGRVGRGILVYDFGGGTFDVAFVARAAEEDRFYLAMEPDGDSRSGGDDLDQILYDYWDAQARDRLGRSVSEVDGVVDLAFLAQCRRRKENLSKSEHATFSTLLSGGQIFKSEIDRATFEGLIEPVISTTVEVSGRSAERARSKGYDVDTILLIGGSSQIPLVQRRLLEALPGMDVKSWKHGDVAVALGAAYQAERLWSPPRVAAAVPGEPSGESGPAPSPAPEPERLDRYRDAVARAWTDRALHTAEVDELTALRYELGVSESEASRIERSVIGAAKEQVLAQTAAANPPPYDLAQAWNQTAAAAGTMFKALQRKLAAAAAPPPAQRPADWAPRPPVVRSPVPQDAPLPRPVAQRRPPPPQPKQQAPMPPPPQRPPVVRSPVPQDAPLPRPVAQRRPPPPQPKQQAPMPPPPQRPPAMGTVSPPTAMPPPVPAQRAAPRRRPRSGPPTGHRGRRWCARRCRRTRLCRGRSRSGVHLHRSRSSGRRCLRRRSVRRRHPRTSPRRRHRRRPARSDPPPRPLRHE